MMALAEQLLERSQVAVAGAGLIAGIVVAGSVCTGDAATPTARTERGSTADQPACEITEWGHYASESERVYTPDVLSVTGRSGNIDDVEFVDHDDVISRELHAGFGVRYATRGVLPDAAVTWHVVYPETIKGFAGWTHTVRVPEGDHVGHVFYDFDYDWEMVPGAWRFDIDIAGQTRCSFTFTVK